MGEVVLGEYWTEREDKSVVVSAASYYTKLESVTCSDSFFVLSEIDYNASPLQFVVSYDKNATAGEKSAEITIKDEDGAEVVIPITATAYTPVEPDVAVPHKNRCSSNAFCCKKRSRSLHTRTNLFNKT